MEATEPKRASSIPAFLSDVITDQGRYSAKKVAQILDWNQKDIAQFLGKAPSTIARRPAGKAYQEQLATLTSVLRKATELFGGKREMALAWLRTPIQALDMQTPQQVILDGHIEIVQNVLRELESGVAL